MRYGYAMHAKYKFNKEMKRNVRFEDSEETVVIDIKLPGREKWITVSYERALRDQKDSMTREHADINDDVLSTNPNVGQAGGNTLCIAASSAAATLDPRADQHRATAAPGQAGGQASGLAASSGTSVDQGGPTSSAGGYGLYMAASSTAPMDMGNLNGQGGGQHAHGAHGGGQHVHAQAPNQQQAFNYGWSGQ